MTKTNRILQDYYSGIELVKQEKIQNGEEYEERLPYEGYLRKMQEKPKSFLSSDKPTEGPE